jgi:hypothetical protein
LETAHVSACQLINLHYQQASAIRADPGTQKEIIKITDGDTTKDSLPAELRLDSAKVIRVDAD